MGNLSQTIRNTETATEIAYFTLPGSTGHLITLVMIILYTSALKRLRNHCFELFWYAHHLFIIFFGALLVHGAEGLLQPPVLPLVCRPGPVLHVRARPADHPCQPGYHDRPHHPAPVRGGRAPSQQGLL